MPAIIGSTPAGGPPAAIVLSDGFSGSEAPEHDRAESVSQRTPGIGSIGAPVRQHG